MTTDSRSSQISFNAEARATQNHMTGNIMAHMLPAQLRPVYAEMVRNDERPWAMVTMTQGLMAETVKKAPAVVVYPPIAYSFRALASQRAKQF